MLRTVTRWKRMLVAGCLPLLMGAVALAATSHSQEGPARTLTSTEMSQSYGGVDFIDKCLQDVPGCSDQDDYWTFYFLCLSNSYSRESCAATPAAFYNYGYVNSKGCEKPLVPATESVTCIQDTEEVVCSYFTTCEYSSMMIEGMEFGICAPDEGVANFWAPMFAFELVGCGGM